MVAMLDISRDQQFLHLQNDYPDNDNNSTNDLTLTESCL